MPATPASGLLSLVSPARAFMMTSTVFLVDDDRSVRTSLALFLRSRGLTVEAYADGPSFLDALDPNRAGCLILDLRMPGMDGLEVQAELARRGSQLPILFLTAYGDIQTTVTAIKAGAQDFLTKPPDIPALLAKVQELLAQVSDSAATRRERQDLQERLASCSGREREVLALAVQGLTSKEIAQRLGVSQRTVENHRLRINRKLDTSNLLEFASRALSCGVDPRTP